MESKQEQHGIALSTESFERTFPHLREMRESAEKEARLFPSIVKTELESVEVFEAGGEVGLYSAFLTRVGR